MVTTSCAWPKSWPISAMRPAGLPARALEPVLQLAVLEILEVERRRVLHQAHAGGVGELLGEQRIDERDDAAEHVGEHGEPELAARAAARDRSSWPLASHCIEGSGAPRGATSRTPRR